MRVKRFVGDNVAETMAKIKLELGSEAVILQTRQIKEGGYFGFFGKSKVEITAAIEEGPVTRGASAPAPRAQMEGALPNPMNFPSQDKGISKALESEMHSMRDMLENIQHQIEGLETERGTWPPPLASWAIYLRERGMNSKLVKKLIHQVQLNLREEDWHDDERVRQNLKDSIREICSRTEPIRLSARKPLVVALIGPTGVGKTTTIAKLAAGFSIVDKRKVALITADTYRVAAVEQLKIFGEIIGIEIEVVMNPSALMEAIALHADKELIFIDTAGRSPYHEIHMTELKAFFEKVKPDVSLLVLSATTDPKDQARTLQRFETLTTHLIITKLDETVNGGALLNLIEKTKIPVAYLTHGQNVPDDIAMATPERLTDHILLGFPPAKGRGSG